MPELPEFCPITKLKLETHVGKHTGLMSNSYTLDRIDNSKGYIKGNVAIISHKANRMKSDLTLQQIENLYNYVKQVQPSP